jgi:multiple sugar transport system substrate-binding protein
MSRLPQWRSALCAAVALAVAVLLAACGSSAKKAGPNAKTFSLTIAANAVVGGKNDQTARWITQYVIPNFEKQMAAEGKHATIKYDGTGVADENYQTQLALDFRTGGGPDVVNMDGIWMGEFATAGYLKPLTTLIGPQVNNWSGWSEIPPNIQANLSFNGQRYGIPQGTDGRVLYFNKQLFSQAGLPTNWRPHSWADVLSAARQLKAKLPAVTPVQINAGVPMGEATTTQGFLPLLAGTGALIYNTQTKKWLGDTPQVRDVLTFYKEIYSTGLGDPKLQLLTNGRDQSFAEFAAGKIGILLESDYLWDSVINPSGGIDPMKTRDQAVGYALIPAMQPGSGVGGQSYVSISGGGGNVINPGTKYPNQAWQLLTFMSSQPAALRLAQITAGSISQRKDVNAIALKNDPLSQFIATSVLPHTYFRPSASVYPQVSIAVQNATQAIVSGKSPSQAASSFQSALEKIVGASNVESG